MTERNPMPVCTPEAAGVPSGAIERYIQRLTDARLLMHDVLIARNGALICEAYWKPIDESFRHREYSCSKSFVSVAVGLLIERGRLHMEDRCVDFFADVAPADVHPWLKEMTIRDCLRMATCYEAGSSYKPTDPDWARTFFTAEVSHKPGQVYAYCTTATTMLCMIIQKAGGQEFMSVLRPVFDEIGVSRDAFCVETPCGHEWGGSGVCLTAREFLKFADLCTHYGAYHGKQLLPEVYMREATTKQIDNGAFHAHADEDEGYGYQFWPMRNGGFAMHGMGGQFALCLPDKSLTLITNAYDELNAHALCTIFDAFWEEIYPNLSPAPLPEEPAAHAQLTARTNQLSIPTPPGNPHSAIESAVSGRTYEMAENRLGMKTLRFDFTEDGGTLTYENASGVHTLPFGAGHYHRGPFPETEYYGRRIGTPCHRGYDSLTAVAWRLPNELMLYTQIIDIHLANLRIAFAFESDSVTLNARKHAEWFLTDYEGFATGTAR